MSKKITAGIFGFGVVGEGLYRLVRETAYPNIDLKAIVVKEKNKKRILPEERFSYDDCVILGDPEIELVIEVTNDSKAAFKIVKAALENGKHVVSANKRMIAEHLEELIEVQKASGKLLLYEAAVAGAVPIIQTTDQYLAWQKISKIEGILNGTSNYILTEMNAGRSFDEALRDAQLKGYAEADPTMDIAGHDALFKTIILALHGFGKLVKPEDVFFAGIQRVNTADIEWGKSKNLVVKQTGNITQSEDNFELSVTPVFLPGESKLGNVHDVLNAVEVQTNVAGNFVLEGEGAGAFPTAQAVLGDIEKIGHGISYVLNKGAEAATPKGKVWDVYLRTDTPSVLESLSFIDIDEETKTHEQVRIVGKIHSDELKKLTQVQKNHLFIARIQYN